MRPTATGNPLRATQDAPERARFAITVHFEVRPECIAEFVELARANAAASVRDEPHCLRFDVLTPLPPAGAPGLLLYEVYEDRAAFDSHLESAHFRGFDDLTQDMVVTKTVRAYEVLENAKP